jgi:hypothetical protein
MNIMFKLYKDGQLQHKEFSKEEIEHLGELNKPGGYHLLIFNYEGIAVLEKDIEKLSLIKRRITDFETILSQFGYKAPEDKMKDIQRALGKFITDRLEWRA